MRKIRTAEPFPAQHSVLDNSQHYRRNPEFGFSANRRRPKRVLDRLPGWRRDGYTNTEAATNVPAEIAPNSQRWHARPGEWNRRCRDPAQARISCNSDVGGLKFELWTRFRTWCRARSLLNRMRGVTGSRPTWLPKWKPGARCTAIAGTEAYIARTRDGDRIVTPGVRESV